jgi:hypothetical protein
MKSVSLTIRTQLIQSHESGMTAKELSNNYQLNYNTVLDLIRRYKKEGAFGIVPHYSNCGRLPSSLLSKRLVRLYRYFHPTWGVAYILIKIREKHPNLELLHSRTYERYLESQGAVSMPKSIALPIETYGEKARTAHETWQVDAKEQLKTQDGQPACYLTFTDECTGAILVTNVFSLWTNQPSSLRANNIMLGKSMATMGTS